MSLFTNQVFPGHMSTNSQFPTIHAENEIDEHREYKGRKFMFVSYCPKEKVWHVAQNRFLLNKNSSTISGQFITSNWFNKEYLKYDDAYFVVVTVEKNMSAAKIEKDFNKLKNPFPTVYDIPPYVKIASYFKFGFDLICKFVHKTQRCDDSFEFTVRGTNSPWSTLTMKVNKNVGSNKESILMCHPTFDMPLF